MSHPCCCFEPGWAYILRAVLEGATELMIYFTPVAICVVVWDVFSNHDTRKEITVLGLDAAAPTYFPASPQSVSGWRVILYLLTSFSTFGLGVLIFDAVQALS